MRVRRNILSPKRRGKLTGGIVGAGVPTGIGAIVDSPPIALPVGAFDVSLFGARVGGSESGAGVGSSGVGSGGAECSKSQSISPPIS